MDMQRILTPQEERDLERAKRYVEEGDETFRPVVEFFKGPRTRGTKEFRHCREVMQDKVENFGIDVVWNAINHRMSKKTIREVLRGEVTCQESTYREVRSNLESKL